MAVTIDKTQLQAQIAVSNLQKTRSPALPVEHPAESASFLGLLQQELEKSSTTLSFSKHAMKRVNERSIDVSSQVLDRVSSAVEKAEEKGIKDALIIGNNSAFIVNIPTRTIITTLNGADMNQAVFTNIDGTVLL